MTDEIEVPFKIEPSVYRRRLGVEESDVAEWLEADVHVPELMKARRLRFRVLPAYAAGIWLRGELRKGGVSAQDSDRIGFAAGQMMAMAPDPWLIADSQLRLALERGEAIEPGRQLADALLGVEDAAVTKRRILRDGDTPHEGHGPASEGMEQ